MTPILKVCPILVNSSYCIVIRCDRRQETEKEEDGLRLDQETDRASEQQDRRASAGREGSSVVARHEA